MLHLIHVSTRCQRVFYALLCLLLTLSNIPFPPAGGQILTRLVADSFPLKKFVCCTRGVSRAAEVRAQPPKGAPEGPRALKPHWLRLWADEKQVWSAVGLNRAAIAHQTSPFRKGFGAAGRGTTATTERFLFGRERRC